MEVQDLLNSASRDLPQGWLIQISIEKGAAWVELQDPEGEIIPIYEDDTPIEEQVKIAIEKALGVRT